VLNEFKDENKMEVFLRDFLTEGEFEGLSKRLAVSYWLKKERSYENIKENLKVSSATIASVSEMMKKKGFEMALKNLEAEEWAQQWSEKIKKFVRK
jgi:uncharacterized protein YerC